MLVEQGHKPAVWMSELDQESNSGAHLNSCTFVMADGSYSKPVSAETRNVTSKNTTSTSISDY